jgi:glyoxylate/hydroxypyruvate reductase A
MSLLIKPSVDPFETWVELFAQRMPELEVRLWPDLGNPADVEFAMVRRPDTGVLAKCPNLRWIASIPAGVDHLWKDTELPPNVPIVRCTYDYRAAEMGEYVLLAALSYHRQAQGYRALAAARKWERLLPQPAISERPVTVLGLGELGIGVATKLRDAGFPVRGWTRTPRTTEGIETFHGADGFEKAVSGAWMVVCVLPMTDATRGILNARLFSMMARGGHVVNVARGEHMIEADLVAALDSGQLAGATLDVLRVEPPPPDDPLPQHPLVTITPHVSTLGRASYMMDGLIENMRRARAGEPLLQTVDRAAGY